MNALSDRRAGWDTDAHPVNTPLAAGRGHPLSSLQYSISENLGALWFSWFQNELPVTLKQSKFLCKSGMGMGRSRAAHSFHTTSSSGLKCGGGVSFGCRICRKKHVNATFKSGHGKIVTCNHMPLYSCAFGCLFKSSALIWGWQGRQWVTGVSLSLLKSHLCLSVNNQSVSKPLDPETIRDAC